MIEFEAVSKLFAGASAPAVDQFSCQVPTHKTTVLVGSSGSGKTTLLRMVNRMVEPTSGRVLIDGTDVATKDPVALRRSIGYVMQNSGLLPHRTVADNIATVPRLNGTPKQEAHERAIELLEVVGLNTELARRYPHELSGGQAQRVGVARALADDPNILLMDEPFGAVDPVVRRQLQDQVLEIQEVMSKTILMVTHDIDEAFLLGDNIVLLSMGAHIEQAGTASDFVTKPATPMVEEFTGAGDRKLRVETRDGVQVVLDKNGRVRGVLE